MTECLSQIGDEFMKKRLYDYDKLKQFDVNLILQKDPNVPF